MRLFETIVTVDWSASATPARGSDSLWIGVLDVASGATVASVENPPTRREALDRLVELVEGRPDQRVLIGFDFAFGYPVGLAAALGLDGEPWRAIAGLVAELLTDGPRNANNRFAVAAELNRRLALPAGGPFWGCPAGEAGPHLQPRKPPPGPLVEWRAVEARLRAGGRRPFSGWQLAYAGSVGGQALTGLAALAALERQPALAGRWLRWPFDTGFALDPIADRRDAVVVAEVWPSLFDVVVSPGEVRDAAQVRAVCAEIAAADADGRLLGWMAPVLDAATAAAALAEEGWVLGVS